MKYISKSILTITAALCTAFASFALPADFFTRTSKLAGGKWVKIRVAENGVYEISYDDLRAAGFSNPEAVGVFGRGGLLQPGQFIPAKNDPAYEQPYQDDITAIPVMHRDGKLYFYGQGSSEIYSQPVDNKLFVRKNINTYSTHGYYLLSDIDGAIVEMQLTPAVQPEAEAEVIGTCVDYFYHESEQYNHMSSGTTWMGEDFNANGGNQSFAFSIPGTLADGPGSAEVKFAQAGYTPAASWLTTTLDGDQVVKSNFVNAVGEDMYTWNSTQSAAYNLPAQGTLDISFVGAGNGEMARLDYILLGATKNIGLADGQAQARAFLNDCNEENIYSISNATESMVAWDVASPSDIKQIGIYMDGDTGYMTGIENANTTDASGRHSVLMLFDTTQAQMQPEIVGEVANQNLHDTDTPNLVIITTETLREKAEQLADLHRSIEGMDVVVVLGKDLYNEFSAGTPDAMAYRAFCKMLYDRNPAKLKNVLLMGDIHYDNRQLTFDPKDNLLTHQYAPREQSLTNSFMLNDYFGMMQDTYKYTSGGAGISQSILNEMYWQSRSQEIGVGVLAFHDADEVDAHLEKIARYLTDDTFGYWGNNYQWTSDGGDNNLHLSSMLSVMNNQSNYAGGDFNNLQAHVAAYPSVGRPVHTQFVRNLERGSLFSAYLGHGMANWIGDVLQLPDNSVIRNDRLSFMAVGGCTISEMGLGFRGVIDNLVFAKDYGFIGALVSDRPVWADDNRALLQNFFNTTVLTDAGARNKTRLAVPRTIGEVYAKGKTLTTGSTNKFAYHLVCDPAITVPLSTHKVELDKTVNLSQVYPGSEINISGSIKDRSDKSMNNYNGYVVLNILAPAKYENTLQSPVLNLPYEETVLSAVSLPVVNGKFSGTVTIPANYGNAENVSSRLRLCAFDPETRLLATGNTQMTVLPYDETQSIQDSQSPNVEQMYANSPEAEMVSSNFTLYATVTDNTGLSFASGTLVSDFHISIDGRLITNAQRYITLDDMGKTMKVIMPFRNINNGIHKISLYATDLFGNSVENTIQVRVGIGNLTPVLSVEDKVARNNAVINIDGDASQSRIYIHDMRGNLVYSANATGSSHTWNLKDSNNQRVPAGVYTIVCSQKDGDATGSSQPLELIVLAD